jgi:outer membrane protein assembly factor BamB
MLQNRDMMCGEPFSRRSALTGRPPNAIGSWAAAGAVAMAIAVLAGPSVLADDWPQFMGPNGQGWSAEKGLDRFWPKDGPKVLWTAHVALGYACPAIRDGEVFLLDRDANDAQDVLRCLNLADGKERWRFAYDAPARMSYPGSRNTPTVTAEHVYTIGAAGHIHCLDRTTRKVVWAANAVEDFRDYRLPRNMQAGLPRWGFTQQPVVRKDVLIVAPYAVEAGAVAYDRLTGKVRWRSGDVGTNVFSHATPYVTTLGGVEQVVIIANKDGGQTPPAVISGVELATGKVLWQTETWKPYNIPIPMPVKVGEDRLFFAGGYAVGCFILKVARSGEGPEARWSTEFVLKDSDVCTPHIHTPVLYKGLLYANSFDKFHNEQNNGLVCMKADGQLLWRSGGAGAGSREPTAAGITFDSGGFLLADDLIYIMHGDTGELYMLDAAAKEAKVLGRGKVLTAKGKKVWAALAMSRGKLIVRDLNEMKCVAVGSGDSGAGDTDRP